MKIDGEGPRVGRGAELLGVRVGAFEEGNDISPDSEGFVQAGEGGMSVGPSPDLLPLHRLPRRLRTKYPNRFAEATGSNNLHCWWMGTGAFVPERVADRLRLRLDLVNPEQHGLVEPDERMRTADYEKALIATRDLWQRWEE